MEMSGHCLLVCGLLGTKARTCKHKSRGAKLQGLGEFSAPDVQDAKWKCQTCTKSFIKNKVCKEHA